MSKIQLITEWPVQCKIDRVMQIATIIIIPCGGGWYKFACIDEAGRQYLLADKVGLRSRGLESAHAQAELFATNPQELSDPGMKFCSINRNAS